MKSTIGESKILNRFVFAATLAMTYLTIVKELVLYQNSHFAVLILIHKLAMRAYYPLLGLNLAILVLLAVCSIKTRSHPVLLQISYLIFGINIVLFSSNNLINWIEGQPIHRRHQGIGW